jgi:hypothetical protein
MRIDQTVVITVTGSLDAKGNTGTVPPGVVTWTSDNGTMAPDPAGTPDATLTPASTGTAKVTATINGISGTAAIPVTGGVPVSLVLSVGTPTPP